MAALLRHPKHLRRLKAREFGRRSVESRRRKAIERGPDFETLIWRAKQDRKGTVVREGVLYRADGRVQQWAIRHALRGRSDSYEILLDGAVWKRGGPRVIQKHMPGIKLRKLSPAPPPEGLAP